MFMKVGDYANLRLHRGYILPAMKKNPKLSQQFIGPFKILRRVGRLAYELDIPPTWRIHPVFTIAMLEPAPPPDSDPFHRPRPNHPESVEVDGEPEWEIERLLDKRTIRKGRGFSTQYLVRWLGYGPEHDQWYPTKNLLNAAELIEEYEKAIRDREG